MASDSPMIKDEEIKTKQTRKNKTTLSLSREMFIRDLIKFHESRGTPIVKFPKIGGNGKQSDVDLYKLYDLVISKGGWMKVNSKNEWSEVEKEIGFPEKCVNSELALKYIYIRYFDKYERYNFLGEEKERIDDDEEENRHKRWSGQAKVLHSIPQSYNYNHHNISNSTRETNKLSTNLYQSSEYDKLAMSLLSPLPNEQDFAINVLTLMSNECKQTLRLGKCPRLIGNLLAHAGCFEHSNLREMFVEFYTKVRGYSQESYWIDLLSNKPDLLYLIYEDTLCDEQKSTEHAIKVDKIYGLPSKDIEDFSLFSLGRGLGTQDYIGQRIHQVATIIRNLSFFEENVSILARDKTLLRFLVMTANVRWNNLHMMALDVIGNIAKEIELKDPFADLTSRHLFGTICDEIETNDRATIISAMEILSKLCSNEMNEDFLLKNLRKDNYKQICLYLLVPDMMLLIYTLECIYSLTSLGEKSCNTMVDIHGLIDTLVAMITLEAQSLGPDSCIQMKVVETVPTRQVFHPRTHVISTQKGNIPDQQRAMHQSPIKLTSASQQVESPSKAEVLIKQNQQQIMQENEQYALAWIRNNFELSPSLMVKIEEHDMYRMYLNACSKVGRKGVISQVHFPRCVRSIFGGSLIGPNLGNSNDVSSGDKQFQYYCGIKPRSMNIPTTSENSGQKLETIIIHPTSSPLSPVSKQEIKTEDSVLIAQLNGKTATSIPSLLQQALSLSQPSLSTQSPITTTSATMSSSPATSTSLIKSLLANKVTTSISEINSTMPTISMSSTCVSSANVNSLHQVAQRQQISQKQKLLSDQLNASITNQSKNVTTASLSNNNIGKIGASTISIMPKGLQVMNNVITTNDSNKAVVVTTNDPPPLAPLSTQSNKTPTIVQAIAINSNNQEKGLTAQTPISQKLTANKMLVDLLDKKAPEPPVFAGTTIKRKIESDLEAPAKKIELEYPEQIISPSPKAADLYAKLAGSILEDEEMEEDEVEKAVPAKIIEKKIIEVKPTGGGSQIITTAQVQRQIIMGPNNQVILSPNATHQTTATIKTDSGIQTVPIILQNNALQGIPAPAIIQQPAPTQYILATNQQGQTYVVAQQPIATPQMPQMLLAQGQQGSQTKTIIILQQPQGQHGQIQVQPAQQQKIIMTPSGQQVIYSSPVQRQVIHTMSQPTISTGTSIVQSTTTTQSGSRKIVITNASLETGTTKIIRNVPQQSTTKIVQHSSSHHSLQSMTQNQNIIVQKGQKFQIGSTQISQVLNPISTQQQQQHQIQQATATARLIQKNEMSPHASIQNENLATIVDRKAESSISETESSISVIQHQKELVLNQVKLENQESIEQQAVKLEETTESSKDFLATKSPPTTSDSSSSSLNKQTISIQIPVPQSQAGANAQQYTIKIIPSMDPSIKIRDEDVEPNWLYICDWRGCPKKKFQSANEVYLHACDIHCPSLDANPDLFCQWGGGNSLCDNIPRKRFSLMTHILDRHCTAEAFKASSKKRISAADSGHSPQVQKQPYPVTLYRQPNASIQQDGQNLNVINGPTNIQNAGVAAMQAIKRHSIDFIHFKEANLQDEIEGTVTKSIRLTAALIIRNMATYSSAAKRALRYHEYHLSQIALSNFESNRVIAQVLYEMNEQISPFAVDHRLK